MAHDSCPFLTHPYFLICRIMWPEEWNQTWKPSKSLWKAWGFSSFLGWAYWILSTPWTYDSALHLGSRPNRTLYFTQPTFNFWKVTNESGRGSWLRPKLKILCPAQFFLLVCFPPLGYLTILFPSSPKSLKCFPGGHTISEFYEDTIHSIKWPTCHFNFFLM